MDPSSESVVYQYQSLLFQPKPNEEWGPKLEVMSKHFLPPSRVKAIVPQMMNARQLIAQERDLVAVPEEYKPFDPGFIELPDKLLMTFRKQGQQSEIGQIQAKAAELRENADRVIILGIGGSYLGTRALFEALCSTYHNELQPQARMGTPRIYFEGNNVDNDALQDLLEMLQNTCIDPKLRDERWGVIVVSKSGKTLETAATLRVIKKEAADFYGTKSPWLKKLIVPVTGAGNSPMRAMFKAEGYADEDIFTIPDRVGGRFSAFTAAGLLPAAVMGLDIRALLLGASHMTKRFLEEPFERNPVLQFAAVNHLMYQEIDKPIRVLSVWSKKLEALGFWYDQLLAESLGKQGQGATPITTVQSRDLHSRGQPHQEGRRDKMINNLVVKAPRKVPIAIAMADRNEDGLNEFNRKTYPEILAAALRATNESYAEVARPTADIVMPIINEYTVGQVMQMLMLATVVEARLMGTQGAGIASPSTGASGIFTVAPGQYTGINPYGQPGVEAYKRRMMEILRSQKSAAEQAVPIATRPPTTDAQASRPVRTP